MFNYLIRKMTGTHKEHYDRGFYWGLPSLFCFPKSQVTCKENPTLGWNYFFAKNDLHD